MPNGFRVGCGTCFYCRQKYAREMAFRCEQEAYDKYVYNILLTYDDEKVPLLNGRMVLNRVHFQDFMKRFRYWCKSHLDIRLRYFGVGEYGGKKGRPHYHLILFTDIPLEDRMKDKCEPLSFINSIIESKWRHGAVDIEPMKNVGASVRYFVQYLLMYDKKDTQVKPFRMMSRGDGGLGYRWLERTRPLQQFNVRNNSHAIFHTNAHGVVCVSPIPRYYQRKYIPEELLIARADDAYYAERENKEFYMYNLTRKQKIDYGNYCHEQQQLAIAEQIKRYRQAKVHENNRSACRAFAQSAKRRKGAFV